VIVDVLSFSTSVTIATGRGTIVYPHAWPSPNLDVFAASHEAVLAVHRREVSPSHPWSLSPAHLLDAPAPERLVLPSPNGSSIAASAINAHVLAGCLRNATAVARWLERHDFAKQQRPAVVIAAGERWPSGALRPALEDLLGAGAIIASLPVDRSRSPEAAAAEACWRACRDKADELLRDCATARQLTAAGYPRDVDLAAEHDAQDTVPLLTASAFRSQGKP
jgi:2-phosphosulfolactate phosphatase